LQAIAMAIITRWFMPPDIWCGNAFSRDSGAGMPTWSSSSMARAALPAAAALEVCAHRLGDLEADGEAGIERGHRLLEDHRHVLADDAGAAGGTEGEQVGAGEPQASAVTRPSRASRPMTASMETDLPEPDSPTMATTSPSSMQPDAVDGAEQALGGRTRR
jgi:hypothetical protein